jgi:multidrug resistance efflux pump
VKRPTWLLAVGLIVIAAAGWAVWDFALRRPATPADRLFGNGTIETTEVDVTAPVSGTLISLVVQEGDSVRTHQLIASLDAAALEAQVQQALDAARAAQAQLQELQAGTRPEEIARARAQYQAAIEARSQAKARLDLVRAGPRREQIDQLRAGVRQAQAALDNAETELGRTTRLEAEGAVSRQQLDLARTQRDTAAAQLDAARQRLLEAERGSRPEDLRAAQAALEQADSQAKAARAALDLALAGPRAETIAAARARAAQAGAAVEAARVQRGYATIQAPMDGTVTLRSLDPGDFVIPGTPIVRLAALDRVWLRVYVPEQELGRVKLGQRAEVSSDTYPGKAYPGRVIEIAQQPEFTPKNVQTREERVKLVFGVKIAVENPHHELKPGMPADASILVGAPVAKTSR